jgi:enamine deaminase RidA (YjgF/YER057c/UK114 family)
MKRTQVNPSDWGLQFAMSQGEIVEGVSRQLRLSGQVAVEPDPSADFGIRVVGPGDIRAQMVKALQSVDDVLEAAGMGRENVVHLHFFTTDPDGFLANYDVYAEWIAPADITPPQSLIGVQRLALPDLLVEIEATAAA